MATAYNEPSVVLYASMKYTYNFLLEKMEVKLEEYSVW